MLWLDVLGWAGSALLVFSVMQARVLRFRALNLLACVVLTVFNGLTGAAMKKSWTNGTRFASLTGCNADSARIEATHPYHAPR